MSTFATLVALALLAPGQLKPLTPDQIADARRAAESKQEVFGAALEVRNWAWDMTAERFPIAAMPTAVHRDIRRGTVDPHPYLDARLRCFQAFRNGGYRQLMKRYNIETEKEVMAIAGPEHSGMENGSLYHDPYKWTGPKGKVDPSVHQGPRYFDPRAVRLSDKDAKWLNWTNPAPERERSKDPREVAGEG